MQIKIVLTFGIGYWVLGIRYLGLGIGHQGIRNLLLNRPGGEKVIRKSIKNYE